MFVAGVVAYWAEGEKSKPWRRNERVAFVNSDPSMIRLFLAWLASIGVELSVLRFRVSIHESADVQAAERYWRSFVGAHEAQFSKTLLKRHKPVTNRRNRGESYRGCLIIVVRRSTELYRRIEGWYAGVIEALMGWESDEMARGVTGSTAPFEGVRSWFESRRASDAHEPAVLYRARVS